MPHPRAKFARPRREPLASAGRLPPLAPPRGGQGHLLAGVQAAQTHTHTQRSPGGGGGAGAEGARGGRDVAGVGVQVRSTLRHRVFTGPRPSPCGGAYAAALTLGRDGAPRARKHTSAMCTAALVPTPSPSHSSPSLRPPLPRSTTPLNCPLLRLLSPVTLRRRLRGTRRLRGGQPGDKCVVRRLGTPPRLAERA